MFRLMLLMCLGIVKANEPSFNFEQFHEGNKPPIYVEEMEMIKFYSESWKVVTRIDMNYYQTELNHMKSVLNEITKLCTSLNNDNSYIQSMYKLTNECNGIVNELKNIVNETSEINWIQFKNSLSQNEAETYLQKFDELNEIKRLPEIRTTLINSTIDIFTNNKNKLQLDELSRQIEDLNAVSKMSTSNIELKGARMKHLLQDIIFYTMLLITDFKVKQNAFFEALAVVGRGGKHQMLLSPKILLLELVKLKDLISLENMELPFNLYDEPITKFYDVAILRSIIINKQLIAVYTIPIVHSLEFTLYQLNPYPRKMEEGIFQLILPDSQFIILDEERKHYIIMDEHELSKCYSNQNNTLLCRLSGPIISTENTDSCTIELLTKPVLSANCNYRITNITSELFFKLADANSWLFVFPRLQKVTVDCNGEIDNRYVAGEGILTIRPKCSAKTKSLYIKASEDPTIGTYKSVEVTAEMKFNWRGIMDSIIANTTKLLTNNLLPTVINDKQSNFLEKISTGINDIKVLERARSLRNLPEELKRDMEKLQQIQLQITMLGIPTYIAISIVTILLLIKMFIYVKRLFFKKKVNEEIISASVNKHILTNRKNFSLKSIEQLSDDNISDFEEEV